MAKKWKYIVDDNIINVSNSINGSELYINGKLQDKKNGLTLQDNLAGKLPNGFDVKASLGGIFTMQCTLFVNNVLQEPVEES